MLIIVSKHGCRDLIPMRYIIGDLPKEFFYDSISCTCSGKSQSFYDTHS
jgi:hypothetical protein